MSLAKAYLEGLGSDEIDRSFICSSFGGEIAGDTDGMQWIMREMAMNVIQVDPELPLPWKSEYMPYLLPPTILEANYSRMIQQTKQNVRSPFAIGTQMRSPGIAIEFDPTEDASYVVHAGVPMVKGVLQTVAASARLMNSPDELPILFMSADATLMTGIPQIHTMPLKWKNMKENLDILSSVVARRTPMLLLVDLSGADDVRATQAVSLSTAMVSRGAELRYVVGYDDRGYRALEGLSTPLRSGLPGQSGIVHTLVGEPYYSNHGEYGRVASQWDWRSEIPKGALKVDPQLEQNRYMWPLRKGEV